MTTIYHNPRCSKSRQTLSLLEKHGAAPDVIEYLKTPPNAARLKEILALLDMPAQKLIRRGETLYKTLRLDKPDVSEDRLIAAMLAHPVLIERPIVLANGKAAIGRPPESVLGIL